MKSEDVKLATTKQNSFTVTQSILNPTPWFFHNEKWRECILSYMISIIKTRIRNNPTNNVKTRMKNNQTNNVKLTVNPITSIKTRTTRLTMLIKIKIPVLFINIQFKIQVLWFSFLSWNKFIFLFCVKHVKPKMKTAMSVLTPPLFSLKAPLTWIQIFMFLDCSKIKRTCIIWLWMGNGKLHCKGGNFSYCNSLTDPS